MLKSHQIPLALPVKNTDASCFMLSSHFLWSLNMKICSMIKTSTYPLSSGNIFQTMKGRVIFPGPAGVFICWGTHTQKHNFIEQEHNYSQLSHFIDEEIEIEGNCHNCSHMCLLQTCQSSHELTFSSNIVGPQLLHYAFVCPLLAERVLLATGKGQIIEQCSISLKFVLCVGVKKTQCRTQSRHLCSSNNSVTNCLSDLDKNFQSWSMKGLDQMLSKFPSSSLHLDNFSFMFLLTQSI